MDLQTLVRSQAELTVFASFFRPLGASFATIRSASITLFAPTDAAFASISSARLQAWQATPQQSAVVLEHHSVAGAIVAADLMLLDALQMLSGHTLSVDHGGGLRVGSAYLVRADLIADDGVLHLVDAVLGPPELTR